MELDSITGSALGLDDFVGDVQEVAGNKETKSKNRQTKSVMKGNQ
jgi:hypothetical protein